MVNREKIVLKRFLFFVKNGSKKSNNASSKSSGFSFGLQQGEDVSLPDWALHVTDDLEGESRSYSNLSKLGQIL
jgi:hypothetical protein